MFVDFTSQPADRLPNPDDFDPYTTYDLSNEKTWRRLTESKHILRVDFNNELVRLNIFHSDFLVLLCRFPFVFVDIVSLLVSILRLKPGEILFLPVMAIYNVFFVLLLYYVFMIKFVVLQFCCFGSA